MQIDWSWICEELWELKHINWNLIITICVDFLGKIYLKKSLERMAMHLLLKTPFFLLKNSIIGLDARHLNKNENFCSKIYFYLIFWSIISISIAFNSIYIRMKINFNLIFLYRFTTFTSLTLIPQIYWTSL